MRQKVLLFGGSFDPPHKGHVNLLQNAVDAVQPDKVLIIPSWISPHKNTSATPWALRAQMCKCFCAVFPSLEVSDIEEERQGKSYTYDTLCELRRLYPESAFYLCVGGDMLRDFTAWYRWQDILAMVTLVGLARQSDELPQLEAAAEELRRQGGRVLMVAGPVVEASSTQVRRDIAAGGPNALALVPPPADEVICQNGLYGCPSTE